MEALPLREGEFTVIEPLNHKSKSKQGFQIKQKLDSASNLGNIQVLIDKK